MMRVALCIAILGTLCAAPKPGLTPRDAAIIPVFQKDRPELRHFAILRRHPLHNRQDLLVAFASPRIVSDDPYHGDRWWAKDDWVGVFLQDHDRPPSIRTIALVSAQSEVEGLVRVKRLTTNELLLVRVPEKGGPLENVELLFNAQTGR